MKQFHVYIMSSQRKTLYTGVTNDLKKRVYQHKHKLVPGFTGKYNITRLVYAERADNALSAIRREKQIKGWLRKKKVDRVESLNPEWRDLSDDWSS